MKKEENSETHEKEDSTKTKPTSLPDSD